MNAGTKTKKTSANNRQPRTPYTDEDCAIWKRLTARWSGSVFDRHDLRRGWSEGDRTDAQIMLTLAWGFEHAKHMPPLSADWQRSEVRQWCAQAKERVTT